MGECCPNWLRGHSQLVSNFPGLRLQNWEKSLEQWSFDLKCFALRIKNVWTMTVWGEFLQVYWRWNSWVCVKSLCPLREEPNSFGSCAWWGNERCFWFFSIDFRSSLACFVSPECVYLVRVWCWWHLNVACNGMSNVWLCQIHFEVMPNIFVTDGFICGSTNSRWPGTPSNSWPAAQKQTNQYNFLGGVMCWRRLHKQNIFFWSGRTYK